MSSGKSPTNFKSVIIRQRLEEIRLRILTGNHIDFEADRQKLKQMCDQAHEIGDTDLELYAMNVFGVLHANTGKISEAYHIYEEGARLALELDNRERWVTFQLNQAVILYNQGQLEAGRALFEGLIPTLQTPPATTENMTRLYVSYGNLALLCLETHDYDGAERYGRQLLDHWDSPEVALIQQERRATMVGTVREVLAAVYCARGNYADSRAQAKLLLAASGKESRTSQTISAYLAFARLAIFDPSDEVDPELHWQQIDSIIAPRLAVRDVGLWGVGSHDLMLEARMYHYRGEMQWARRCAEKAVEILAALDDAERRQIAESFLAELPSRQ